MNIQQIQQAQPTQPAQIIIDSSTAVQATGQNANSFYFVQQQPAQQQQQQINYITANQNAIQMTAIKQPFQFVNNQQQQQNGQQLQTGYKYIASNQPVQASFSSATASPRIIVQPQQIAANSSNSTSQTYMTIAPAQQQQITTTNNTGANISNTNGQIFLINNRIVPLQSIKQPQQQQQQTQQIQRVQVINNQQPQVIYTTNDLSQTSQVQQPQQQNNNQPQQQYVLLSNNNNNNNNATVESTYQYTNNVNSNTNSSNNPVNLGAEITEKMKQLEQIQNQLKTIHHKLTTNAQDPSNQNNSSSDKSVFTQQQIQSILSIDEQSQLHKLLSQRKTVQSEIQQLQQKLLAPSYTPNKPAEQQQQQQQQQHVSKSELLEQVTQKLNAFRASKTVQTHNAQDPQAPPTQQLVLTQQEFEQMKKLMELQSKLKQELQQAPAANGIVLSQANSSSNQATLIQLGNQQPQHVKLSELSLNDKHKLNELIKTQLQQLKTQLTNLVANKNPSNVQLEQQTKDKYLMLMKKQNELQALINQQTPKVSSPIVIAATNGNELTTSNSYQILNQPQIINVMSSPSFSNNNAPTSANIPSTGGAQKQTPIKIRNVIAANAAATSSPKAQPATPLRTLIINNKDNQQPQPQPTQSPQIISLSSTPTQLLPLSFAVNLHKQNFAHVQFKCLNFEELAQHGIITKQTDDLTINLLKQLDERASTVINPEQVQSFAKNQVKLVKKYLEQQQMFKQTVRNRIHDQLLKDQKLVVEPDFRTPFADKTDAIKRLSRYHVLQKTLFEPDEADASKFDECFEQVSERLVKTADAMKKRFHLFQLRSMQKEVVSSEETLLLKLFVDDLKQSVELEKQNQKQEQLQSWPDQPKSNNLPAAESPTTIRKLINNNVANNDFILNTNSLKRPLKCDESPIRNPKHINSMTSSSEQSTNKTEPISASSTRIEPSTSSSSLASSSFVASTSGTSIPSTTTSNTSIAQSVSSSSAYPSSSSSSSSTTAAAISDYVYQAQPNQAILNKETKTDEFKACSFINNPVESNGSQFVISNEAISKNQNDQFNLSDDLLLSGYDNQTASSNDGFGFTNANAHDKTDQNAFGNNDFDLISYNSNATENTNNNANSDNLIATDDAINNSTSINNLSGLDDFMLNEDDLGVPMMDFQ